MKDDINKECKEIWTELGNWWDASVDDGDYFHRAFVFPTLEKLLSLKGGEAVFDAGCGNGAFARRMAKRGAKVLGVDFSSTLLAHAKKRSQDVEYQEMDLTDTSSLQKLAESKTFDRIVCSMVLHDMSDVLPFFESLRTLLKPEGYFVFSIPHPCFNSPYVSFEPKRCLTITDYIHPKIEKMCSKPGQPKEQIIFHRPVHEYFNLLLAQGMVMNGFEEPCVDPKLLPKDSLWAARPGIPPVLISRWTFLK